MDDFEEHNQQRLINVKNQLERAKACDHHKTVLRLRGPHLCYQCTRCGQIVGGWVPKREVKEPMNTIEPFNDTLHDKYLETVRMYEKEFSEISREIEWEIKHGTFTAEREAYMKTPQWAEKRQLVFRRCKRVCEGCGMSQATEVHHLTYNHLGNEFLFELVGLCSACHQRYHDKLN